MTGNFHYITLSHYACITWSGYLFSNPMIISRETLLGHTIHSTHQNVMTQTVNWLTSIRSMWCGLSRTHTNKGCEVLPALKKSWATWWTQARGEQCDMMIYNQALNCVLKKFGEVRDTCVGWVSTIGQEETWSLTGPWGTDQAESRRGQAAQVKAGWGWPGREWTVQVLPP